MQPSQIQRADGYLTHQARIASELLKSAKYSELTLKVRRNFDISPSYASATPMRSKSAKVQPAAPLLTTTHLMNKAYLLSPGTNSKQKSNFRSKISRISVPNRDFSTLKSTDNQYQNKLLAETNFDQQTDMSTESQILARADVFSDPKTQRKAKAGSILLQNFRLNNAKNAQEQTVQIIPKTEKTMSREEKYIEKQHKNFWREVVHISKSSLVNQFKMDQILTQAGQDPFLVNGNDRAVCEIDKDWTILRRYESKDWSVRKSGALEKQNQERKSGFRSKMFKSKLQTEKLESEARIQNVPEFSGIGSEQRSKSLGSAGRNKGVNWKNFDLNELKNMYREPEFKAVNQIGVNGEEVGPEVVMRSKSTGFNVLDQFKIQMQNKVIEKARAVSVRIGRSKGEEQEPEEIIEQEKIAEDICLDDENQNQGFRPPTPPNFDEELPVNDQIEYLKKLHMIQKQMLIPGNAPLPPEFFDICDQLNNIEGPEIQLKEEIVADEKLMETSFDSKITSQATKNNIMNKWNVLNPSNNPFENLQTHEQVEADRLYQLSQIKPRPITPENVRWIQNQRSQLENAIFPVQRYPQLAIFTKLSSLDVEGIKMDLKNQIDQCEKEILQNNDMAKQNAFDDGKLSDIQQIEKQEKKDEFQDNYLLEMRSKSGAKWNAVNEHIEEKLENCKQKDRFGRVFVAELPTGKPNQKVKQFDTKGLKMGSNILNFDQIEDQSLSSDQLEHQIKMKIDDLDDQKQFLDLMNNDNLIDESKVMKLDELLLLGEVSNPEVSESSEKLKEEQIIEKQPTMEQYEAPLDPDLLTINDIQVSSKESFDDQPNIELQ